MTPFYFRNSGKALFGIYHPPSGERVRNCGIVICHPIGHEYIHGYRAFRQLAHQLARAGFAVLRFDYQGCGDSVGDAFQANLTLWMSDVQAAIEEIQSRGAISKICLIGARIGATLSLLVGSGRSDLGAVVLWDPVVNGKRYLDHLIAQQQEWLGERPAGAPPPGPHEQILEVLGFPISTALKEGLEQVNLLNVKVRPAKRVLTLETDKTDHGVQLSDRLKETGAESEYQHIAVPRVWLRKRTGDNIVVPTQTLQAIIGWVSKVVT